MVDFEGEVIKKFKIELGTNFKTNTLAVSYDGSYAVVSLFEPEENVPHLILFSIQDDNIMIKDCINFKTQLPETAETQTILSYNLPTARIGNSRQSHSLTTFSISL